MEDRSSRRLRTLVTQMAPRGLSANEIAGALISMMARSPTSSNQRPDTLMQDRSPPTRRKPLATHGRTIHSGQTAKRPAGEQTSGKHPEPDPRWPRWFVAYVPIAVIGAPFAQRREPPGNSHTR